eukprot:580621-Rhodomonas_salina.2
MQCVKKGCSASKNGGRYLGAEALEVDRDRERLSEAGHGEDCGEEAGAETLREGGRGGRGKGGRGRRGREGE